VRFSGRLSTNTYSVPRFKPYLGSLSARRSTSAVCRFCGFGERSQHPWVTGHRYGLYLTPRGEGRILPVFVRAFWAEQFVLAAALTPTLRPWWLVHALRAFRAISLPSPRIHHPGLAIALCVAMTFDLTCLMEPFRVPRGFDARPCLAVTSGGDCTRRSPWPGCALFGVQPPCFPHLAGEGSSECCRWLNRQPLEGRAFRRSAVVRRWRSSMMRALPFGRFSHLGASCGSARTLGSAHEELPGRTHLLASRRACSTGCQSLRGRNRVAAVERALL
jgi:hypothetical protein